MKTTLPQKSKKIAVTLSRLKDAISKHYQNRLNQMILYGSYARGDFNEKSDIDILVVLNGIESEMKEIDTLAEIKTDILLDSDIYISINPVSTDKLKYSSFLYYKNIRKEGVVL
jgi:predicted nucleotidyltransferase